MKKILVGAAVGTAGLLALTGATFAQTGNQAPGDGIKDRVAEILGIAPEDLQDAVQQAREEQRDEQIAERLATAVENEVITQEEADAVQAWLDSMPEALEGVGGNKGLGVLVQAAKASGSDERIAALVARMVAAEKITEEETAGVTAWLNNAPVEVLEKIGPVLNGDRRQGHHHRRGFQGRMFGGGPGGRLFEGRFQIRPYTPPVDGGEASDSVTVTSVAIGVDA
jgi:hypothetical protein